MFEEISNAYKSSRKTSYEYYCSNSSKWNELYEKILFNENQEELKLEYGKSIVCAIDFLIYLFNIRKERQRRKKGKYIVCNEGDVLYLYCQSDVQVLDNLDENIINDLDDFCEGRKFHESLMKDIYERYVGKLADKYPTDFNELKDIANQEREMLDNLYFWLMYKPNPHLIKALEKQDSN